MPKFFSVRKAGAGIGDGMYSGVPSLHQCPGFEAGINHPCPWEDTALFWDDTEGTVGVPPARCRFGFGSLGQLKAWLYNNEWREYLHEHGYVIKVWDLPDSGMHVGSAQAIAVDSSLQCTPCEYISLLDLESMYLPF